MWRYIASCYYICRRKFGTQRKERKVGPGEIDLATSDFKLEMILSREVKVDSLQVKFKDINIRYGIANKLNKTEKMSEILFFLISTQFILLSF